MGWLTYYVLRTCSTWTFCRPLAEKIVINEEKYPANLSRGHARKYNQLKLEEM
ncbi:hypothetical protein SAMN05421810_103657 [Amycolatopsis arida]|uniref:Uncharacterized protein n=1 Tax=Amycolatopsis arida TaxID=587909 RepID=A0A1I5TW70_9PSEU|nr:hypothetical protein CLV69_103100 [Amycolatopsis arida]SFP86566.1 hypothetical protein SAMN05421810_103657 [Amycolatopsis arida]